MIEINTTDSVGSTTTAAQATAKRGTQDMKAADAIADRHSVANP